jgi:hypothetical protein
VPYTNFASSAAADTAFTEANNVTEEQPWSITKTRDVQFGTFDAVTTNSLTCLNPALVSTGDTLTVRRLTDGVLGQSYATANAYMYVNGTGISSYDSSTPITVTNEMRQYMTAFYGTPKLFNPNSTDSNANAANKITAGTHTFEISIVKADGTEVSGACLVPAPTTPTATLAGTTVTASATGYNESYKIACQVYDSTTNLPVGDLTEMLHYNSFSSNSCYPTGVPTARTVYVKFVTWREALPGWKTYSPASNTVTIPGVGINLTSTASNGTTFGQVTSKPLLEELNLGSQRHAFTQVTDPTGGYWELASMSDSSAANTAYKIRHVKSTGVDSNFTQTTWTFGSSSNVGTFAGWHGTLASPKLTVASMENNSTPALTVTDFATTGAQGASRSFNASDLDSLCSSASGFGSGFFLNSSQRIASVLSAPTADVYLQISCQSTFSMSAPTKYGYLVIKINLATSAAPTIVTNLGVPTDNLPNFHVTGGMSGVTGVDYTANPTATGTAPMFTFLSLPLKQDWSNFSTPFTYGVPKFIRVSAAGVVSTVDAGVTVPSTPGNAQVGIQLEAENFGAAIFTVSIMGGQGAPSETVYKLPATGAATTITLTYDTTTDFPAVQGASDYARKVIGLTSDGQLVLVRARGTWSQQNGSSTKLALAKLNLTTGAITTFGEAISYTQPSMNGYSTAISMSGNSMAFIGQDLANPGKLIFQYVAGGDVATNGGGGNSGGGSTPTPTGDGTAELGKSTNAGGTTFTLTGTSLNLVTEVWVGGVKATIKTKADGTITVQVPAGTSSNAPVVFKYTGGEVTAGVWNYVGANKVSQTVTVNVGGNLANYADADRTLSAISVNSANSAALNVPFTFSTTTPKVCVIVDGNKLHQLSSGVCTVKTSQAGNAWLNKAADVLTNVTVIKASQAWTTSPASTLSITDVTPGRIVAVLNNSESVLEFNSLNPTICDVDAEGTVTGFAAGTCTVTVSQPGDARYVAISPVSVTVTVTADTSPISDFASTENDSGAPKAIPSGAAGTFVATNDPSFQLSWNSATGKLIPRATGIYLGNIDAKVEFTKNSVNYTCVMTFGKLAKMPVKTAAQRKAAKAGKVFTTTVAFCSDSKKLSVPASLDGKANFAKLKSISKTTTEKAIEKAALAALKGFTGNVTITVTRYRAWWSTLLNVTGDKGNGKKIKATKRVTVVTLG